MKQHTPILLAALFMLPFISFAQTEEATVNYFQHSVGVNFSNDVTSQIENYPSDVNGGGIYDEYDYDLQYGYSAALLYQYRPAEWFSVETGVEYNSTKYYQDYIYANKYSCFDGENFNINIFCFYDRGLRKERIAVPLNLRWYYQKNKWSVYALTGILFGFDTYIREADEIEEWNRSYSALKENTTKQNFGLGISAGVGFECLLARNLMLRAEPRFRLYDVFKPERAAYYSSNKEIKEMHWAVGLNLGIYYGFGAK